MSPKTWCALKVCQIHNLQLLQLLVFVRAFLLESKHPIYWEVNFVYILNNLPAHRQTPAAHWLAYVLEWAGPEPLYCNEALGAFYTYL